MKQLIAILYICSIGFSTSFAEPSKNNVSDNIAKSDFEAATNNNASQKNNLKKAYFASGCFWCVEAIYESIDGVKEAVSGYSGGHTVDPTYREISGGDTGHAETVEVIYDPEKVSFKTLVKAFFDSHDPTTLNQQGPDHGTQYRSIAFYQTNEEKQIIEDYIKKLTNNRVYKKPIVTEVKKFVSFWQAEAYHQDFEERNPYNSYILNVSKPRLEKFKEKFDNDKK